MAFPSNNGGAAEWLRRSVSNHAKSIRVDLDPSSKPLTNSHKPAVNSAIHPSDVGKWVLGSNSGGTSTGHN